MCRQVKRRKHKLAQSQIVAKIHCAHHNTQLSIAAVTETEIHNTQPSLTPATEFAARSRYWRPSKGIPSTGIFYRPRIQTRTIVHSEDSVPTGATGHHHAVAVSVFGVVGICVRERLRDPPPGPAEICAGEKIRSAF